MDNLNIRLAIFGLEVTLKEVIDDLANAASVKKSKDKDNLIYEALGKVKALYKVIEVKSDKAEAEKQNEFVI